MHAYACSGKVLGTFLQGLKETGADPGELLMVEWIDINVQTRTFNINHPVKGHNPRIVSVSRELIARFEMLPMHAYYHETRDILKVKQLLGHKTLKSTMVYIDVERAIYGELSQEFNVKIAEAPEEVEKLLEVGFEYVCEKDGRLFFRKRK